MRLSWLRWSAASLALFALLGVSQILPALHFVLVAHRICAEHGETLHADGGDGDASEAALSSPANSAEVAAKPAPALPDHEHEHCSVLGLGRSASAHLTSAAGAVACRPPRALPLANPERVAHVDIALLLYAPKLAPPV